MLPKAGIKNDLKPILLGVVCGEEKDSNLHDTVHLLAVAQCFFPLESVHQIIFRSVYSYQALSTVLTFCVYRVCPCTSNLIPAYTIPPSLQFARLSVLVNQNRYQVIGK